MGTQITHLEWLNSEIDVDENDLGVGCENRQRAGRADCLSDYIGQCGCAECSGRGVTDVAVEAQSRGHPCFIVPLESG